MRKVVDFKPYTIPLKALFFNESDTNEEEGEGEVCNPHLKESQEDLSLNLKSNPIQSGPISHTNDTSSMEDFSMDKPIEIPIPSQPILPKLLTKKRGRRYKNLKDCFKCDIDDCETLFEKMCELIEHKKTHEHLYPCAFPQCSLVFMKEANMLKHKKTHMPSGKRYECPYPGCGKKFTASYNQKIHYRLHTGERPYKCDKCGNDYYDRANYKYHMRTAHLNIDMKDTVCSHLNCEHSFKTKKQKLIHHDKLDEECRYEKNLLIRMLISYKDCVNELIKGKSNEEVIRSSKQYVDMKKQNDETLKRIMDVEQYEALFFEEGK